MLSKRSFGSSGSTAPALSAHSAGEGEPLSGNQISQVLITRNAGVPRPRTERFSSASALSPDIIASAPESLRAAKTDPEEFCWPSEDRLMEKGLLRPLPRGRVDGH